MVWLFNVVLLMGKKEELFIRRGVEIEKVYLELDIEIIRIGGYRWNIRLVMGDFVNILVYIWFRIYVLIRFLGVWKLIIVYMK